MSKNADLIPPLVFLALMFMAVLLHPKPRGAEKPDPKRRRAWLSTKAKPRFWWYR